jgi:thioredoxin reductase (NADPH)
MWDTPSRRSPAPEGSRCGVTHVRLRTSKTGAVTELPVDGVFVAIGHAPATSLFAGKSR